ncbi:MAG: hypothetical protein GXP55_11380 [Deltaproteobacteria bacterium]|nr:hypothetical protein [Deltaproteobacteria bacterium]
MSRRISRYGALALLILPGAAATMSALSAVRRPVDDPDVFWIAAAGRELLEGGALLRENFFSFSAPHTSWVMHEWLLGAPYAWGLAHFGAGFFGLVAALVVVSLTALLLFATPGEAQAKLVAAAFYLPLFGVHLVSARPMVLALLPAAAMLGLAFSTRFGRTQLILAPLLSLLWVNLHGSFPLGPVFLLVAALDARRDRRLRLWATLLSALTLLLQPHGLALFELVLEYLGAGTGGADVARARLLEFQPLFGAGARFVSPTAFAGLALLTLVALWLLARRRAFARVGLFAATGVMATLHARHADLAGLVGAMLLIPAALAGVRWRAARNVSTARARALVLLPALALCVSALWAGPQVDDSLGGSALPRLLADLPEGAHLYTPFALGGRAEWLASGRGVRVFYDSRNDCYPAEVARLAFDLEDDRLTPDEALAALRAAGTTHLVLRRDSPLARALGDAYAVRGAWALYAMPRGAEPRSRGP